MISTNILVVAGVAVAFLVLLALVVRLFMLTRQLNTSFAKLGFVVREDAKKYFDDAAGKLVETNQSFRQEYETIVRDSTRSSLIDSGVVMEKALADAQHDAGDVILKAREEARQIVAASRQNANECYQQSLNQSVEALTWTLSQYVGQSVSIQDHEQIITELLKKFVNENRQ